MSCLNGGDLQEEHDVDEYSNKGIENINFDYEINAVGEASIRIKNHSARPTMELREMSDGANVQREEHSAVNVVNLDRSGILHMVSCTSLSLIKLGTYSVFLLTV